MKISKQGVWWKNILLMAGLVVLGSIISIMQILNQEQEELHDRMQATIADLDSIFRNARSASARTVSLVGTPCTQDILVHLRSVVAMTPFIRSISLVSKDVIYCTTVLGGIQYKHIRNLFPDGDLLLLPGNSVTPGRPFIVYRPHGSKMETALIGIDAFFIYTQLKTHTPAYPLYLVTGNKVLSGTGTVTTLPSFRRHLTLKSNHFQYSVTADMDNFLDPWRLILRERYTLVQVIIVSACLTFLLNRYFAYTKTLDYQLRRGIKKCHLTPYIQPIVNARNEKIIGGEVLLRWKHPVYGDISPAEFIALGEQNGLIHDMTRYCFDAVATSIVAGNISTMPPLLLCFNISANHFDNDDIVTSVQSFIDRVPACYFQVVFEITERMEIADTEITSAVYNRLRTLGIKFALDDFGTGNANYSYLQRFSPDYIKIDKLFTSNVKQGEVSGLIVESIVKVAQKAGCAIVAEGIEHQEQKEDILKYGPDYLQGYLFARAMPVPAFLALLEKQCSEDSVEC